MEKLVTTASPAGASGAANGGGSAVRQGGSTGGFQARMKLRAAIRAVAIVNRNERRLPNGEMRHSVAAGAKLEYEKALTEVGGGCMTANTFISTKAQHFLEHHYARLGTWIGGNPRLAMLIGFIILISGLPGSFLLAGEANVLWIKFDTRMYENFAIRDNKFFKEYEDAIHLNHGAHHPSRTGLLIITPRSNHPQRDNLLSKQFLSDALEIVNYMYNDIKVTDPRDSTKQLGFNDLCAKAGLAGRCQSKETDLFRAIGHSNATLWSQPDPPTTVAAKKLYLEGLKNNSAAGPWLDSDGALRTSDYATEAAWNAYYHPLLQGANAAHLVYGGHYNYTGVQRIAMAGANAGSMTSGVTPNLKPFPIMSWKPSALQVVVRTAYYSGKTADERALAAAVSAWEEKVVDWLTDYDFGPAEGGMGTGTGGYFPAADGSDRPKFPHSDKIDISFKFEASVQLEMAKAIESAVPMVFVTVGVMVLYSSVFLATQVRTHEGQATLVYTVLQGSLIPALSGISALGWMCYFGWQVSLLCAFVLFLVLCVGVDCTFIFISAMKAVGPKVKEMPEAMSMALAEAGPAVTLTSLTSLCAFFLSAAFSTSMTGMMVFNICMAVALLLNVTGFVFFFSAWQVLNEERIRDGLKDMNPFNYRVDPHMAERCPRVLTHAKGKDLPEWADVGTKLRALLVTKYAPFLATNRPFQLLGVAVMFVSFVVSLAFIPAIEIGIQSTAYVSDSSYLQPLFADFKEHTYDSTPLSVGMLVENLDLGDQSRLQDFVNDIITPIRRRDDVYGISCFAEQYAEYVLSLPSGQTPDGWSDWLNEDFGVVVGQTRLNSFGPFVHEQTVTGALSGQPVPKTIECSLYAIQPANNAQKRLDQANFFSGLQRKGLAGTRIYIYSHNFAEAVSNDEMIVTNIVITIVVALSAVAIVLVLALPITRALITAFNILMVVLNILGFMGYSGISYNPVSFCTLTMAIGFCVDYTVEIMHFSSSSGAGRTMGEKCASAIKAAGYDVGHGSTTAFIGVLVLSFVPGRTFRLFGWLSMVMVVYGGAYALWCLPSLMIIVDDLVAKATGREAYQEMPAPSSPPLQFSSDEKKPAGNAPAPRLSAPVRSFRVLDVDEVTKEVKKRREGQSASGNALTAAVSSTSAQSAV